jgi:two-component system response regulator AtoC
VTGFEARPVTGDEVTIGRDPTCELVIDDDAISRRHARLRFGAAVTIEDLDSRNGTLVAGRRLEAHRPVPLELDQPIAIGDVQLFVDRARPAPAATATDTGDGLIVRDPAMRQLHAALAIVAMSPLRVLLLGETGVGKDVCARALHARSRRADRPLLELNCAALPESTLEAELFGYERGAFTGATAAKPGLLEAADGGTVFLDEVGELSLGTQAKLLRVLERGEVLRLGSLAPTTIDVRVVSATNRDLRALVAAGPSGPISTSALNGTTITIRRCASASRTSSPWRAGSRRGWRPQLGRPAPDLAPAAVEALRGLRLAGQPPRAQEHDRARGGDDRRAPDRRRRPRAGGPVHAADGDPGADRAGRRPRRRRPVGARSRSSSAPGSSTPSTPAPATRAPPPAGSASAGPR